MSQMDFETTEIDGYTYKVFMLDPLVATDLVTDLCKMLAPVLGPLGGILVKEKGDVLNKMLDGFEPEDNTNVDKAIERAVLGFFNMLDKVKQREMIAIMSKVTVLVCDDGKEPQLTRVFSKHFQGRLKALYKWLLFALKVQFRDFFSGTDLDIGQFVQKVTALSSSLNTSSSTPTSGD